MPRELFGDVSNPRVEIGSRSRVTLPVSIAVHAVMVALVVVVPLMAPSLMPSPPSVFIFAAPAPLPPPPPSAPAEQAGPLSATEHRGAAPTDAPSTIADEPPASVSVPFGVGVAGGVDGGIGLPGAPVTHVVAIPDPPPPPAQTQPLRPGGDIKEPVKVRHVPPIYPRIAQESRVEGIVILEAVIDVDGSVSDVRVLRSAPLLDQSAIDAVRQWRFTPTLLNGVPVPIIMTVTVRFSLKEP